MNALSSFKPGEPDPLCSYAIREVMTEPSILLNIFRNMRNEDVERYMTTEVGGEGSVHDWQGNIASVSKAWKLCFELYARKPINSATFHKACPGVTPAEVKNIVSLELCVANDRTGQVDTKNYIAFLNLLTAKQLLQLTHLQLHPLSSYEDIVKSKFITSVVPEIERLREGVPIQLDVFTFPPLVNDVRSFFSKTVLKTLLYEDPAEFPESYRILHRLIAACSTIELRLAEVPVQSFLVIRMAKNATTLRLSSMLNRCRTTRPDEDRVVFENCWDDIDRMNGQEGTLESFLIPQIRRLEIEHEDPDSRTINTRWFSIFCKKLDTKPHPLLNNVTEVCILGCPSELYCFCICMPNVRKVELKNISLFQKASLPTLDCKPVLKERVSVEEDMEAIGKLLLHCFPKAGLVEIELKNSAEIVRSHRGALPDLMPWFLGKMHDWVSPRQQAVVLRLCRGVVALSGFDVSKESKKCLGGYENRRTGGYMPIQISTVEPCCEKCMVTCHLELDGPTRGMFERVYLVCLDCTWPVM